MKRALKLLLLLPIVIVVVALSVANRHTVLFSVDPFAETDPALSVNVPLFWLLFGALAIGVLLGGVAAWLRQGKWRRAARHDHAELERMKRTAEPPRTVALPPVDRTTAR
ncbi:MAG: LapA family protein [Bauldia sp.]